MKAWAHNLRRNKRIWGVSLVLAFILIVTGLLLLAAIQRSPRPLKPLRSTGIPELSGTVASGAIAVSFTELNSDPFAFRNRRVLVSGEYLPLSPQRCTPRKGPNVRWALVAEDLRLDAIGFENLLYLVSRGTGLTVTGIWRHYVGLMGCGKEPPEKSVWYLEVEAVLQPNPLFAGVAPAVGLTPESPILETVTVETAIPGTVVPQATLTSAAPFSSPSSVGTNVPADGSPLVSATPESLASPTANVGGPGTPTLLPLTQTATATPTPNIALTPTSGGTSQPGTTGTPTVTTTPGPLGTPTATLPPLTTATPGTGYPGPGMTVTPTATTSGYP